MSPRRRARYRSIYSNGIPLWECGRCGDQKLANTPHTELAEHEDRCGQPRDAGPSVAEAAANDRAHWDDKYAGEGA